MFVFSGCLFNISQLCFFVVASQTLLLSEVMAVEQFKIVPQVFFANHQLFVGLLLDWFILNQIATNCQNILLVERLHLEFFFIVLIFDCTKWAMNSWNKALWTCLFCPVVLSALNLTRAEREPGCVQLKTADLQMRNCNCNDSSTKAHKACPFRPILPAPYNGRDDSYICIMSTFQANQQQAHQIRLFQGARSTFFFYK